MILSGTTIQENHILTGSTTQEGNIFSGTVVTQFDGSIIPIEGPRLDFSKASNSQYIAIF